MKYYDKHGIYLYEVGDIVTIINTPLEHNKYFQTGVNGQIINWHRDMAVYCGKLQQSQRLICQMECTTSTLTVVSGVGVTPSSNV